MSSQNDILAALAKLKAVGNGYQAPKINMPDFSGYGTKYKQDYSKLQSSMPYSFMDGILAEQKKKKVDLTPNLWDVLSGTFGQAGGAVTNQVHSTISAAKEIGKKDNDKNLLMEVLGLMKNSSPSNTIGKGLINGGKQQMANWKDGTLSWGDIPGIGMLNGMDKGWKRGSDIVSDHMGVDNKWGQAIGGFGLDVALDPLTYLTGGATMALKAGRAAQATKIDELAKGIGLGGQKFKNKDEFIGTAIDVLNKKYEKYPNLADKMVAKKIEDFHKAIDGAMNVAHNSNINKWGASIPLSNKRAVLGNINEGNILHRSEATLGNHVKIVDNLISDLTNGSQLSKAKVETAIKQLYKVDDLSKITKTQFEDLLERVNPIMTKLGKGSLPDADIVSSIVQKEMPNEIFNIKTKKGTPNETVTYTKTQVDDILKSLEPQVRAKIEPLLRGLNDIEDIRKLSPEAVRMFGEFAPQLLKTVKGKTKNLVKTQYDEAANALGKVSHTAKITPEPAIPYEELINSAKTFKKGKDATNAAKDTRNFEKAFQEPFDKMFNGKTKFEHWMDKKNPFDARTLQTGDKFLDSMGNHIADADSMRVGENAKYQKPLEDIQTFIKKNDITKEDMQKAIYHIEGKAPKSLGANWVADEKTQRLAAMIKPLLDKVSKEEIASGVLNKTRDNYFPHVLNKSDEEMKEILEFMERRKDPSSLNNKKQTSAHDKKRTSFETLAQRDDYLAGLEKDIQKATDPEEIARLRAQQEKVAEMFDTDVVSALTRRIKEGVRAKAMKEMNGELKKFGMLASNPEDITRVPNALKQLTKDEAKKLGLGDGQHFMHPDVLNGLKRVDEVFTNQGMNKFVRHLNAFSDMWRSLVTHYKPSHYRNNIIGNTMMNMLAGVKPSDYKTATTLINGYRKGTLTPEQLKLMESAYKQNVVSGGFLTDAARSFKFNEPLATEKIADKVIDNRVISKVRAGGEVIDDVTRLANYLAGFRNYGNSKRAAQQVREYLFNYNELTNADRHMRTIVPFWNWTKRNLPLQMKVLMENPKFAMNVERYKLLFNENSEGADWQKESGVKIPGTDYYTSLPSTTHDLNTFLDPGSFLGSMNPAAKMLLELNMNRNMFTKRPISYGQDRVNPEDLPRYFAKNFGITGNIYDAASGKHNPLEAIINLFNPIYKEQNN